MGRACSATDSLLSGLSAKTVVACIANMSFFSLFVANMSFFVFICYQHVFFVSFCYQLVFISPSAVFLAASMKSHNLRSHTGVELCASSVKYEYKYKYKYKYKNTNTKSHNLRPYTGAELFASSVKANKTITFSHKDGQRSQNATFTNTKILPSIPSDKPKRKVTP